MFFSFVLLLISIHFHFTHPFTHFLQCSIVHFFLSFSCTMCTSLASFLFLPFLYNPILSIHNMVSFNNLTAFHICPMFLPLITSSCSLVSFSHSLSKSLPSPIPLFFSFKLSSELLILSTKKFFSAFLSQLFSFLSKPRNIRVDVFVLF